MACQLWLYDFEALHLNSMARGHFSLSRSDARCWQQAICSAKAIIRLAESILRLTSHRPRKDHMSNKKKRDATIVPLPELDYRCVQVSSADSAINLDMNKVRDLASTFTSLKASGEIGERDFAPGFLRAKVSGMPDIYSQAQKVDIPADRLESSAFVLSRCKGLPQLSSSHFLQAQKVPYARQVSASPRMKDEPLTLRLPEDQSPRSLCEWLTSLIQNHPKDALSKALMKYLIVDIRSSADRQKLGFHTPVLSCGGRLMQTRYQIPGVHTPYAYVSQSLSPFSMHIEDAGLQSANILYAGEPKLWVIIAPHHRQLLEEKLKSNFRATSSCAQFVRHLAPIISPQKLAEWEIDFSIVIQRPGELIITFPFAYHFGFNLGPNRAEAINLALDPNWEPPKDYVYCSMKCSSGPITREMLLIEHEPQSELPASPRTESSSDNLVEPIQDHGVSAAQPAATSSLSTTRPSQRPPLTPREPSVSSYPHEMEIHQMQMSNLMTGSSASSPDKSPRANQLAHGNARMLLLSAYGLEKQLDAASQYHPDLEIEHPGFNKSKSDEPEESDSDLRSTEKGREQQEDDGTVLAQLHQSPFLSSRMSPESLAAMWNSKPSDVPLSRALRAIQIAVDIANPTLLREIRTALKQPRHYVDNFYSDTPAPWGKKLALAHMAVSNQLGFVSHAEVVGGAVARAHYFMAYEVARVQLSSRIHESRREKNSARRGRKSTPITDGLKREFGHLLVGKQRDAAELLRQSIVQELIDLNFGCDRLEIRKRVNILLKQGEVLSRIIDCADAIDPHSGQRAVKSLNPALLVLFPGEEKGTPELSLQAEASNTIHLSKPITLNE